MIIYRTYIEQPAAVTPAAATAAGDLCLPAVVGVVFVGDIRCRCRSRERERERERMRGGRKLYGCYYRKGYCTEWQATIKEQTCGTHSHIDLT